MMGGILAGKWFCTNAWVPCCRWDTIYYIGLAWRCWEGIKIIVRQGQSKISRYRNVSIREETKCEPEEGKGESGSSQKCVAGRVRDG